MKKVLYFVFQEVHTRPPCVTEICMLKDSGIDVAVLTTGCSEPIRKLFRDKGIHCHTFQLAKHKNLLIQKAKNFLNYRKVLHWFFKTYWTDESVLWVGTEQTIIKTWPFLRKIHPTILNALEFYEGDWYQKNMKKIAPRVDVLTACEPHRAQYMVDWWKLDRMPYILPNKPYEHPRKRYMEGSTPELRNAISAIQGKKTIMYQGSIVADRDLGLLAKALKQADSEYFLVLSGSTEEGSIEKLQALYERTLYLGNLPAPAHLELTSHADICVAYYKDNCINNRYCAPNKIYEYAGCGVPMLCNNIPGLTETVGKAGAAECVDFRNADEVIQAIEKIDANYEAYSHASTVFYDQTDNAATIQKIVEDAFARTKRKKR